MTDQIEINLANVNQELGRLWDAQKEKKLTKASLFNLIIYANNKTRTEFLEDLLHAILEKYPCRILFIFEEQDSSKNYLRTTVSNIIIGQGENALVCDRINIDVSQSQLYRVPFIILPLLVTDLPIYLFWDVDPTIDHQILPHLKPYAARLVFNSDCTVNLQNLSRKILEEIRQEKLEVRDINWAAGGSWREILAHIFDTQEKIQSLQTCKNIRIEFNAKCRAGSSHPEIQAIYFQAWLAAQLGWSYKSNEIKEDTRYFHYSNNGRPISIELFPHVYPLEISGGIHSIEINTENENILVLTETEVNPRVTIHVTTQDRCEMPYHVPLSEMMKGGFLLRELFYRKTSDHYKNMLTLLAQEEKR